MKTKSDARKPVEAHTFSELRKLRSLMSDLKNRVTRLEWVSRLRRHTGTKH